MYEHGFRHAYIDVGDHVAQQQIAFQLVVVFLTRSLQEAAVYFHVLLTQLLVASHQLLLLGVGFQRLVGTLQRLDFLQHTLYLRLITVNLCHALDIQHPGFSTPELVPVTAQIAQIKNTGHGVLHHQLRTGMHVPHLP